VCAETPLDPVCGALPDPNETLSDVQKCLQSGNPLSDICRKVLDDADLLKRLRKQCAKPENQANQVCQLVNAVPDPEIPNPGEILPTIPALPTPSVPLPTIPGILGRAPYGGGGGSPDGVSSDKRYDSDLAPLLVWGMVDR
jgi:phospholipid/cholesterol/gamma-HCH transport system substrate-binding protein